MSPTGNGRTFLKEALEYAERGWKIIPLRAGKKTPLTEHGLKDASDDPAQIHAWWDQWPDANVGICTGRESGLYVVDVDADHGGPETLAALEAEHEPLPGTFRVRTGGGGEHVYLKMPEDGLRNTARKLGKGLDTRGDGGYVVAAPSGHESGSSYEVLEDVEPAAVPGWLLDRLRESEPSKVMGATSLESNGRILEGERNDALASIGGSLRRRGLEESAIYEALAGINSVAMFKQVEQDDGTVSYEPHPLPDAEVKAIAKSIGSYPPGSVPNVSANGGGRRERGSLRFVTLEELYEQEDEAIDWIAKPWVAEGTITEMSGPLKMSGKSTFALAMVNAIVTGGEFLDEPTRPGPVVFLTEQPSKSFKRSVRRAGFEEGHPDLHILFRRSTATATWEEIIDAAVARCLQVGSRSLVIDTLSSVAKIGDENDVGEALRVMRPLVVAADEHDLGIFVVRHSRKEGGDLATGSRGSTAYSGEVDQVLSLNRPKNAPDPSLRVIKAIGRLLDEEQEILVSWNRADGYQYSDDVGKRRQQRIRQTIFKVLKGAGGTMKREKLREHEWLREKNVRKAEYKEIEVLEVSLERLRAYRDNNQQGGPYMVELLAKDEPHESDLDETEDEAVW